MTASRYLRRVFSGAVLAIAALCLVGASSALAAGAPENVTPPVVSPTTPHRGKTESGTTGTWTNGPTSFAYQWQRCNATGKECANIAGATGAAYTPVEADGGHTLVLKVTATNEEGASSASSAATAKIPALGEVTEYKAGNTNDGIALGPDGNMWFASSGNNKIGRITPAGVITEYALPEGSGPAGVTPGPGKESALWFTEKTSNKIGRITTAGVITAYALPAKSAPRRIVLGPDGNLWFTSSGTNKIGRITSAGAISEYALPEKSTPWDISAGPDGNLWFTENNRSEIGKITPSGVITEYPLPEGTFGFGITAGPAKESAMWFTTLGGNTIGRISTSGVITEYPLAGKSDPASIAAGPDGNLWFVNFGSKKIGRITPTGTVSEYATSATFSLASGGIALGVENELWFTSQTTVGRVAP